MVTGYHFTDLWVLAGLAVYLFLILLVVKTILDQESLSGGWKAFWVGAILFFPVLGFLAWLISYRKSPK